MTNSKTPKRRGYITGDKGVNRVRMYPHERDGMLFLDYRDEAGNRKRLSLGHTDFTRGKIAANELAAALLKQEGPRSDELTLKALFDIYDRKVGTRKTPAKRAHDLRARELFMRCWGTATKVRDLDVTHWSAFVQQRRDGTLRPAGSRNKRGVKNRMIEYDLKFLLAVMHWAEVVLERGKPLLDRNPFRGASSSHRKAALFKVPKEQNPNRPQLSDDEWKAMREAAKRLGSDIERFFLVATVTGHRGNAIRQLRWNDINPDAGEINWRADADKESKEHQSPLTGEAAEELRRAQEDAGQTRDALMFPNAENVDEPISRHIVLAWWRKLEKVAGVKHVKGRRWHCLRRKLVNDGVRAGLAPSVIAEIGGWTGSKTITEVYLKPDKEFVRASAEALAKLRASG